jgi:hypothetical protein
LSKAPLRSAFLKTRSIVVKYSHNNWYIKRGQATDSQVSLYFFPLQKLHVPVLKQHYTAKLTINPPAITVNPQSEIKNLCVLGNLCG